MIRQRERGGRLRIVAAAGCIVLAVGALLVSTAAPASAAPDTTMMYSTDGGATWSPNITVSSGGTVLARAWYNNDTNDEAPGAQVTATLPAGFTLQPNTTRTCLAPDTSNAQLPTGALECSTDDDQADSMVSDSVWSGSNLAVSPTAGLFGFSASSPFGTMAAGRVRYLNLKQCGIDSPGNWTSGFVLSSPNGTTTTDISNTPSPGGGFCTAGFGFATNPGFNEGQVLDVLGQRYINLQQCGLENAGNWTTNFIVDSPVGTTDTRTSNALVGPGACATFVFNGSAFWNGVENLDVLNNRYVNLHQCGLDIPGDWTSAFLVDSPGGTTETAASDTPSTAVGTCTQTLGFRNIGFESFRAFDMLDTDRGRGFVEFAITAPDVSSQTVVDLCAEVTAGTFPDGSDCGTITVDVGEVPLVALPVAGGALALAAAAGGGWLGLRKWRTRHDESLPTVA